jgi:hypothetical protein
MKVTSRTWDLTSSWEAGSQPAFEEICHLLWNPEFGYNYNLHKGLMLGSFLIQMNPDHTFKSVALRFAVLL